jgi:predicted dehydrogenase
MKLALSRHKIPRTEAVIMKNLNTVRRLPRRTFLQRTALALGGLELLRLRSIPSLKALGYKSPNEKLNLAAIGAGGQPFSDLQDAHAGVENVVALADVDWKRGSPGFRTFPKAAKYKDFRQMLDRSGNDIDAVVIGTPDHMHATCALACMQLGKHVYVEKPLTHTPWEARLLTQAAQRYKVATQMGNQGYSHDATRVACEIIWSGEIGDVQEVHAWTGWAVWPQEMTKVPGPTPAPDTLDWDLWLGGAADRPFTAGDDEYRGFVSERSERARRGGYGGGTHPDYGFYLPEHWRGFFDFGSGLIGDWGIHILGPANWALQLSPEHLVSVQCIHKDTLPPFTFPDELTIKYEFGPRPGMPPVAVYWYHHPKGDPYLPPGMTAEEARQIPDTGPEVGPAGRGRSGHYNCIFVGSKGYLGTSGRGEGVGLLPGSRWADYKLPKPYLSRSPGASTGDNHAAHCRDWIRACKGGTEACSNFRIAGKYTEWLLLGSVAVHYNDKLQYDAANGLVTNNQDANKWVTPTFRPGWELKL